MRTFDFSPLFRATVGFDRLIDMLTESPGPDWPPYNIERISDDQYRITMALARFSQDEIELTQQGSVLLIAGQKKAPSANREMLHQGLAFRSFRQTFNLADHVRVTAANLENGLLAVELVREVPEQLKPRRLLLEARPARASRSWLTAPHSRCMKRPRVNISIQPPVARPREAVAEEMEMSGNSVRHNELATAQAVAQGTIFTHPEQVLRDDRLNAEAKRSVLAVLGIDARTVSGKPWLRQLPSGSVIELRAVLGALWALDEGAAAGAGGGRIPRPAPRRGSRRESRPVSRSPDDDGPRYGGASPLGRSFPSW